MPGSTDGTGLDLELEFGSGGVWLQTSEGIAFAPSASDFLSLDTIDFHTCRVEAGGTTATVAAGNRHCFLCYSGGVGQTMTGSRTIEGAT